MTNNVGQFLEQEVYPRIDRARAFADLEPVEKGRKLMCRCPACGHREAYIYEDGFRLRCGRENACGHSVGLLQYIAGTPTSPRGADFIQAVRLASKMAGVVFEERPKTEQEIKVIAEAQAQEQRLEDFLTKCRGYSPDAERYMQDRGFRPDNYPAEFGTVGRTALTWLAGNPDVLLRTPSDNLETHRRAIAEWEWRIVGPIRDRKGRLRGLFGRDISGTSDRKYRYTPGFEIQDVGVSGLDLALANGNKDIVIWEGIWDVFRLRAEGFNTGCGVGGALNRLSADTDKALGLWSILGSFGIRSVTLVTDNDDAGRKGLETAIDNAEKSSRAPEIFVVDPDNMRAKDPDEIVREFGIGHFRELVGNALHVTKYRARQLFAGVDIDCDRQRDAYLEACVSYDAKFTDARRIQKLAEYFWPEVNRLSGCDVDAALNLADELRKSSIEQDKSRLIASTQRDVNSCLAGNDVAAAQALVIRLPEKLCEIERRCVMQEPKSVAEEMDEHFQRWQRHLGKSIIGISCGQPILNQKLCGLCTFGIVAARSNVGKTTEVCGLALEALIQNPDVCVVIWSIEMSRQQIIDRMGCYLSRFNWESLKMDINESEKREHAYRELCRLGERMLILDRDNSPIINGEQMLRRVAQWKDKTECKRVLGILDYMDVLEIGDEKAQRFGGNERMEEKEQVKTCQLVAEAIGDESCFIGISSVRKGNGRLSEDDPITLEDLQGSARKGYAADWTLVMNPLTNKQLVSHFEYVEYVGQTGPAKVKYRGAEKEWEDEKELRKELKKVNRIRAIHGAAGISYGQFSIVKGRDGMHRHDWLYTNQFTQSRIIEGID